MTLNDIDVEVRLYVVFNIFYDNDADVLLLWLSYRLRFDICTIPSTFSYVVGILSLTESEVVWSGAVPVLDICEFLLAGSSISVLQFCI